ncbi:hypothetical protein DNL40_11135 [Xylanimonas oleitrophica]|uniref:Aminoglycoside phosphotransferase domain-containing protein n=1 Tax=Xylanimonas oleitrophica TaxID=2607479 RepID=A0A2W5WXX6_9MICO|nr:aminoglycoside phosphotransferase family protein [Xylanimonas oleitrophica]PZR52655.1 hypothetical protein DNL40_11135 [Xylanimonas oleitrophica]
MTADPARSRFDQVRAAVGAAGGQVVRAWPRDAEHLLLDLTVPGGPEGTSGSVPEAVAAQWFADPARAARVGAATPGARVHGSLVLQPQGADRRLPALQGLLADPGARLVAHRPERRAVVRRRTGGGTAGRTAYAKTVRASRFGALVDAARAAEALPLRTPAVLDADPATAVVTLGALPGRPLHDLLDDPLALVAARHLGTALARLHALPVPAGTAVHDAEAEAAVTRRWAEHARAYGLGPATGAAPVPDLPLVPAKERTLLHRDLHDKQVLVDDDGSVGLLDFDLLAAGDPALDLANLRVHLELRQRQGLCADPEPLWDAVLDGYRPAPTVLARVPAWAAAARERLRAVYAFRPADRAT